MRSGKDWCSLPVYSRRSRSWAVHSSHFVPVVRIMAGDSNCSRLPSSALSLLMFAAALNMSGLFEVGGSVQGLGSGLASGPGLWGAYFTGALAAVVAAPCTAPFMGPAVGWALTQTALPAMTIFVSLGLGLAAPFVAIAFYPRLHGILPRPGLWMERIKHGLAFPMYASAAWLAWVLAVQAGVSVLPLLFAAAILVAFAGWMWGLAQRGGGRVSRIAALPVFLVALVVAVQAGSAEPAGGPSAEKAAGLHAEPWSPARLAALRAEGHPVFVDFTAAWCVTCKVNEAVALHGAGIAEAFARAGMVYMRADWTNQDAGIAAALAEHGRSGVPLYLVYGTSGTPKVLPQLLTPSIVRDAIRDASAMPPTPDGTALPR